MKNLIKVLKILSGYVEDFFIFIGLFLIIIATFIVNIIAGIYTLGFICLAIGFILARQPPRR